MKILFRPLKLSWAHCDRFRFEKLPTKESCETRESVGSQNGGHPLTLIILLLTLACCLAWVGTLYFASDLHKGDDLANVIRVEEVTKEDGQCQSLPDVLRSESKLIGILG